MMAVNMIMVCAATYSSNAEELRSFVDWVTQRRMLLSLTNQHANQLISSEQLQRVVALIKRSNHMVVEYSADAKPVFSFVSPGSQAVLGMHPLELVNQEITATVRPEDQEALLHDLRRLRSSQLSHLARTFRRRHKDGESSGGCCLLLLL